MKNLCSALLVMACLSCVAADYGYKVMPASTPASHASEKRGMDIPPTNITLNGGPLGVAADIGQIFHLTMTLSAVIPVDKYAIIVANEKSPYLYVLTRVDFDKTKSSTTFDWTIQPSDIQSFQYFWGSSPLIPDPTKKLSPADCLLGLSIVIYGEQSIPGGGYTDVGNSGNGGSFSVNAVLMSLPTAVSLKNPDGGVLTPFTFHLSISYFSGTQIPDMTIDWGDGSLPFTVKMTKVPDGWNATVYHGYTNTGTYTTTVIGSLVGTQKSSKIPITVNAQSDIVVSLQLSASQLMVVTIDPVTMGIKSVVGNFPGVGVQVKYKKIKGRLPLFQGILLTGQ